MAEGIDASQISGECEELDLTGSHLPDLSAVELPDNLKVDSHARSPHFAYSILL